jgi:hypothetical protein
VAAGRAITTIRLEVGIEPPDQRSHTLLCSAVSVGEGVKLVDKPLGVDPAQSMAAELELAGIVSDDDRVGEQAMGLDAAPQRPFGGDLHRIGADRERGDAEPVEMRLPTAASANHLSVCSAGCRITGPASARLRI